MTVFYEKEFESNRQFFIRALDATQKKELITVIIAESSQCRNYIRVNEESASGLSPEVAQEIIQGQELSSHMAF